MKTDRATSRRMSRQRASGTRPERAIRTFLRLAGVPFEANVASLPGTPDVVVRAARLAVFVHG